MLEFLLFLNAQEKEIIELITKANYKLEENTPLCLIGKDFFGFLKKDQKTVVICTANAKDYGGYMFAKGPKLEGSFKTGQMIRRAIRHEAIHIAQECNKGRLINPGGKKNMEISSYKLDALKGSTQLTGNQDKEYEAYAMEDHPRKVISALKRFCFNSNIKN
ncbi:MULTISPECIES: hypothetical protein [unclassified Prochlorococcus]|uniref:hypothetical protein n=1 Tax=unclassified Prochlorococcus TaxID=2627481 RepID=UPI0005338D2B|nr:MULTISPECIES: hypothetical protein [unclassified Prochlorococcus]KGG15071.1 putative Serine hydroxymethyltransferase [Prochlorococcus sp. MIT 0602]KGG17343.1 putative Serine hydroxymethyltransferase [Prochlorococcus sp. MIT 0603]